MKNTMNVDIVSYTFFHEFQYSLEDSLDQQSGIMSNSLPVTDNRDCEENCNSMIKSAPPLPTRPKSGDPRSPTRPALEKYK